MGSRSYVLIGDYVLTVFFTCLPFIPLISSVVFVYLWVRQSLVASDSISKDEVVLFRKNHKVTTYLYVFGVTFVISCILNLATIL